MASSCSQSSTVGRNAPTLPRGEHAEQSSLYTFLAARTRGRPNSDTGGEFVSPTQAACSRVANREQRVRETGSPAHQSSSRITLIAAAVRTCCRWALDCPMVAAPRADTSARLVERVRDPGMRRVLLAELLGLLPPPVTPARLVMLGRLQPDDPRVFLASVHRGWNGDGVQSLWANRAL